MHAEFVDAVKARRRLAKLITGRKPTRRGRGLVRPQVRPKQVQLAYFGALRSRVLQPAKSLVDRMLVPELASIAAPRVDARLDAGDSKKVNKIVSAISGNFFGSVTPTDMEDLAARYADATSDLQRRELGRQLRAAVGVEVPINDRALGPAIEHFTATNVSLIKTIPQRYFAQIEAKVLEGVGNGSRWEDIAADLEDRYRVSESVAKVIARDQVGKFYASLNETRQSNLGITHFYWQTANDERVCPICGPLNGKRFAWDKPPSEGLPSEVHPQCGCSADPDTDQLLDDLSGEATDDEEDRSDRMDFDEANIERDEKGRFAGGSGGATTTAATGPREISPKDFHAAFSGALKGSDFSAHVTHYSEAQLKGMRLFSSADGKAGVAVHDHGDGRIEATALFSNGGEKGAGLKLLDHVITHAGVNYVECYGPKLNQLYESLGFKVSTRDAFNRDYASPSWNSEKFDSPDYFTMRLPE